MKTKKYLSRIVVGATAFLFSLGIFAMWRHFRASAVAPPVPPTVAQIDSTKLAETYPLMPTEADKISPLPETVADEAASKFDPEGSYQIKGDAPKGFKDFVGFSVNNKDYRAENDEDYGKLMAPEGYVNTEEAYKFNRVSIGSEQIQFETERVKGISYTFSGRFTETRNFVYLEAEAVENVLEGRLVKNRYGKKIAEAQVTFGWFIDETCGC